MNPGVEPVQDPPFRMRSLALSIFLPAFLFSIGQGAAIPIIPLFAIDNLGTSIAMAGFIVALRGIGTMLFDIPAGILVARLGERVAMLYGSLALAAVSIAAALSQSIWLYAVLIFLLGVTWSVWQLARLLFVSEHAPLEQRGRALSLLGGAGRVGHFIGPLIGGAAGVMFGLSSAFYIMAFLALVGAAAMMVFVRESESGESQAPHHGSVSQQLVRVLVDHRRIYFTAGMVAMCISILRNARQAILPLWGYLIGLDAAEIGVLFALSAAIDMTIFYPVGIVMDRFGRKWAAIPCLVLMGFAMCLIPLTSTFMTLVLVGLLLGLGNGLGAGIVMTLGADFAPPGQRGEFLGVWRLIADVGQAAGPVIISVVSAVATLGAASVTTGGLGLVAALVMFLFVPEPLRRARPTPPPAVRIPGVAQEEA